MAGFVALLAVLVAALYVCWLMFQPFLNVLLWAGVLAVVTDAGHLGDDESVETELAWLAGRD